MVFEYSFMAFILIQLKFDKPAFYHFKHSEKILIGTLENITLAINIELEWYLYVSPPVTFVSSSPEIQMYNKFASPWSTGPSCIKGGWHYLLDKLLSRG